MNVMHPSVGLPSSDIPKLYEQYGLNILPEKKDTPLLWVFLRQFNSILVYLLLLAAAISFAVSEYADVAVIMGIVVLNGLISFVQEAKAKKEVAALRKMTVLYTRVIRDGKEQKIEAKYLVPGDIVIVESGDRIPADGKIIWEQSLGINEASLTGESATVMKRSGDDVFLATTVLSGRAHVQITKIGPLTKFGQVAGVLETLTEEKTPLEIKVAAFSRRLVIAAFGVITLIVVIGFFQGRPIVELVLSAVALAVAAIPEGLPAVLTIALAVGVRRLASKKAIVKRLVVAEALGSIDVICTDKTGTLTKNEMVVEKIWSSDGNTYSVSGVGYSIDGLIENEKGKKTSLGKKVQELLKAGVLCNSASLVSKEGSSEEYEVLGDTTEGALLILAKKAGLDIETLRSAHQITGEIPFDSTRKMMSVVSGGILFAKGAPEAIIQKSTLSKEEREAAHHLAKEWGKEGYRVLSLATKKVSFGTAEGSESELTLLGMVALADAPRKEAAAAISACTALGITPIMITGDSAETAFAIACAIGLASRENQVMSGVALSQISDEQLRGELQSIRVFSRVDPLQKLRIVGQLQAMGKVVAVTGDGVNDAPALKKAQVGVAMGRIGTDVARESADLIITDDNFATIVTAVSQGRLIYANLTKTIHYLLASNLGEIVVVVTAMLLSLPLPFSPLVLLWVNVIGDGLPALALAVDPTEKEDLKTLPKSANFLELKSLLSLGLVVAIPTLIAFLLSLQFVSSFTAEITFTTLIVMEVVTAFLVRGKGQNILSNKLLLLAVALTLLTQLLILFVPALHDIMFSQR